MFNSPFIGYGSGILGNSNWLNHILLPDVKFETVVKLRKYYVSQYEEMADKSTPVQALSSLSLNRLELERICNQRKQELIEEADSILNEEKGDILFIVETAYTSAIDKAEQLKQQNEGKMFAAEEHFQTNITPYLKKDTISDSKVYKLYASTEYYYEVAWKLESLERLITTIIGTGDVEYPTVIDKELEKEDYQNQNIGGRPKDESANQQEIIHKVAELAKIKRFQKKDGTPKPTTIRDEIYNNHPDIAGEISSRQLFNRVQEALIYLGMKEPLTS